MQTEGVISEPRGLRPDLAQVDEGLSPLLTPLRQEGPQEGTATRRPGSSLLLDTTPHLSTLPPFLNVQNKGLSSSVATEPLATLKD